MNSKFSKRRKLLFCVHVLDKTGDVKLGTFHIHCGRATTATKCTKKLNARPKLLFCRPKLNAFLPLSLLNLPNLGSVKLGNIDHPEDQITKINNTTK